MNLFFVYTIPLAVFVLLTSPINSKDSGIQIVLKYCTSVWNEKYVEKILTPRKPINRTTSLTSLDIYFLPNVSIGSPLYMHIIAYKKFATQYKPFMVDLKGELCESIKLKTHPLYVFFLGKAAGADSNIMDPCPLQGHIYVKPYHTEYKAFPALLPTGMWRLDVTLTKGLEEQIMKFVNYYEIIATGISEF